MGGDILLWFWFAFLLWLVIFCIFAYSCWPLIYLLQITVHSVSLPACKSDYVCCMLPLAWRSSLYSLDINPEIYAITYDHIIIFSVINGLCFHSLSSFLFSFWDRVLLCGPGWPWPLWLSCLSLSNPGTTVVHHHFFILLIVCFKFDIV